MPLIGIDVAIEWAIGSAQRARERADTHQIRGDRIGAAAHLCVAERFEVLVAKIQELQDPKYPLAVPEGGLYVCLNCWRASPVPVVMFCQCVRERIVHLNRNQIKLAYDGEN